MATILNAPETKYRGSAEAACSNGHYLVVHPLDDAPEEKVDIESLGPMPMTRTVKLSLLSLRAYLILMLVLVVFHVLQLAGH